MAMLNENKQKRRKPWIRYEREVMKENIAYQLDIWIDIQPNGVQISKFVQL